MDQSTDRDISPQILTMVHLVISESFRLLTVEEVTLSWTSSGNPRTIGRNTTLSLCSGAIIDGIPQPYVIGVGTHGELPYRPVDLCLYSESQAIPQSPSLWFRLQQEIWTAHLPEGSLLTCGNSRGGGLARSFPPSYQPFTGRKEHSHRIPEEPHTQIEGTPRFKLS